MEEIRLICEDCGVKWFVPDGDGGAVDELPACAACGGQLVGLEAPGGGAAPGWPGALE